MNSLMLREEDKRGCQIRRIKYASGKNLALSPVNDPSKRQKHIKTALFMYFSEELVSPSVIIVIMFHQTN